MCRVTCAGRITGEWQLLDWMLDVSDDKKKSFESMLRENSLGAMALLRNLRGMVESDVDEKLIRSALLSMNAARVLPFRFIAAAIHAPRFEQELEQALFKSTQSIRLPGKTAIMVDVSGSMKWPLSAKSTMQREDAAYGLAMIAREVCESVLVFTFSNDLVEVAPRRGFALRDAMNGSQMHRSTYLGAAVSKFPKSGVDRLIVITDEQSSDPVGHPGIDNAYMINLASAQNGLGYGNVWKHINGWSEHVLRYIMATEGLDGVSQIEDESEAV